MKQPTDMGSNRTGIGMAPKLRDAMISGASSFDPVAKDGGMDLDELRIDLIRSSPAVGSTPAPSSIKGAVKTGAQAMLGRKPSVFMDKLGERLAFERTGTRLYEAIIDKFESEGSWKGGPDGAELRRFHDEERAHFYLLKEAVEKMGGDPTTVTPSADIAGVASEGVLKVITDPRSSLDESLQALLIAELTDNAAWETLIDLADGLGQSELVDRFRDALAEEENHLARLKAWISSGLEQQQGT